MILDPFYYDRFASSLNYPSTASVKAVKKIVLVTIDNNTKD